jgi:hypothetical protein
LLEYVGIYRDEPSDLKPHWHILAIAVLHPGCTCLIQYLGEFVPTLRQSNFGLIMLHLRTGNQLPPLEKPEMWDPQTIELLNYQK